MGRKNAYLVSLSLVHAIFLNLQLCIKTQFQLKNVFVGKLAGISPRVLLTLAHDIYWLNVILRQLF